MGFLDISDHGGSFGGGLPIEAKPFMDPAWAITKPFGSMYLPYATDDHFLYNPKAGLMASTAKPQSSSCGMIDTVTGVSNTVMSSGSIGGDFSIAGIRDNGDFIVYNSAGRFDLNTMNKATGVMTMVRTLNVKSLASIINFERVWYSPRADVILVCSRNTATNTSRIVCVKGDCSAVLWTANISGTAYPEVGAIFSDGVNLYITGQIYNKPTIFLMAFNPTTGAVVRALTEIAVTTTTYSGVDLSYQMNVVPMGNDLLIYTGYVEYDTNNQRGLSCTMVDFTTWTQKASTASLNRFMVAGYDSTNFYRFQLGTTGYTMGASINRVTLTATGNSRRLALPWISAGSFIPGYADLSYCRTQTAFEYKQQAWWEPIGPSVNPANGYVLINLIKKG